MKKSIKISVISLVVAVLGAGLIAYAAEIVITPPCEMHTYSVDSINSDYVIYKCVDFGAEEIKTKDELSVMWNVIYVNKPPQPIDIDNSSYLDLHKDNIINAKDYAVINKR